MDRHLEIRWLRKAVRNLDELAAHIARDNPKAATKTVQVLIGQIGLLKRFPEMGKAGRIPATRELVVRPTPYVVAYRVRSSRIEILRILHGAMRWPRQL